MSLTSALLKGKAVDSSLDSLFKNSAGPTKSTAPIAAKVRQPYPEDLTGEHKKKIKTPKPKATHVPKKNKNQQESHDDNEHDEFEDEDEEDSTSKKSKKATSSVEAKYEAKLAPKESKKARNAPKETKDLVQQQTKHDYGEDIDMEESKIEDLVHESLKKPAAKRKAETEANQSSEGTKKAKKEKKTKTEGDSDDEDASPDTNKDGTKKSDDPERQARTAFVGNLAVSSMTKGDFRKLKSTFAAHGPVESIRFRSIAFAELLPRKIAFITGKLHPERDVVNAYIVYKSKDSVAKAVAALNGQLFLNKHIRVDTVDGAKFQDRASVDVALRLHETKMGTRKLRVVRCKRLEEEAKTNGMGPKSTTAVAGAKGKKGKDGKPVRPQHAPIKMDGAAKRLAFKDRKTKEKHILMKKKTGGIVEGERAQKGDKVDLGIKKGKTKVKANVPKKKVVKK
ncbi:Nucleolar protein 12 [Podila verticillata]|nr:Nucleolar protein 12 [Podila verticillata]